MFQPALRSCSRKYDDLMNALSRVSLAPHGSLLLLAVVRSRYTCRRHFQVPGNFGSLWGSSGWKCCLLSWPSWCWWVFDQYLIPTARSQNDILSQWSRPVRGTRRKATRLTASVLDLPLGLPRTYFLFTLYYPSLSPSFYITTSLHTAVCMGTTTHLRSRFYAQLTYTFT